jgi:hypothetical protein
MKNITLPVDIARKGLDLEQIGTLTVVMCHPHLSDDEKKEWGEVKGFGENVRYFAEVGVLEVSDEKVIINLDGKEEKSFWDIEDYDEFDNPIYSSPSPYTYDEDSGHMYWRVKPVLCDMKIIWKNVSDKELMVNWVEECFDSLEDAEAAFRKENEEILKSES